MKTTYPYFCTMTILCAAFAFSLLTTATAGPLSTTTTTTTSNPRTGSNVAGTVLPKPDLMPLGFTAAKASLDASTQWYSATATVMNLGSADANAFGCVFAYRVLLTNDPVNYPVGKTAYCGLVSFPNGLKVLEMGDSQPFSPGSAAFGIPKAVTMAQVVVIADRPLDVLMTPGTFDPLSGQSDASGAITESSESNNISPAQTVVTSTATQGGTPLPKAR